MHPNIQGIRNIQGQNVLSPRSQSHPGLTNQDAITQNPRLRSHQTPQSPPRKHPRPENPKPPEPRKAQTPQTGFGTTSCPRASDGANKSLLDGTGLRSTTGSSRGPDSAVVA